MFSYFKTGLFSRGKTNILKEFQRTVVNGTVVRQRMFACQFVSRLQNSPYFCVFKYARAVKQKVSNKVFSLASYAVRACEARALRARKTHTPRFTDFFTDFEKKNDCFAV